MSADRLIRLRSLIIELDGMRFMQQHPALGDMLKQSFSFIVEEIERLRARLEKLEPKPR